MRRFLPGIGLSSKSMESAVSQSTQMRSTPSHVLSMSGHMSHPSSLQQSKSMLHENDMCHEQVCNMCNYFVNFVWGVTSTAAVWFWASHQSVLYGSSAQRIFEGIHTQSAWASLVRTSLYTLAYWEQGRYLSHFWECRRPYSVFDRLQQEFDYHYKSCLLSINICMKKINCTNLLIYWLFANPCVCWIHNVKCSSPSRL